MMILVKMRKTVNRTNFDRDGEDGLGLIVPVSQSVRYRRRNICAWERERERRWRKDASYWKFYICEFQECVSSWVVGRRMEGTRIPVGKILIPILEFVQSNHVYVSQALFWLAPFFAHIFSLLIPSSFFLPFLFSFLFHPPSGQLTNSLIVWVPKDLEIAKKRSSKRANEEQSSPRLLFILFLILLPFFLSLFLSLPAILSSCHSPLCQNERMVERRIEWCEEERIGFHSKEGKKRRQGFRVWVVIHFEDIVDLFFLSLSLSLIFSIMDYSERFLHEVYPREQVSLECNSFERSSFTIE